MNVLIVKPSSLGDVIHALPAVALLYRAVPGVHLSWLVNEEYASLVQRVPVIDDAIPFRRQRWGSLRHLGELVEHIRELRSRRFNLAVDLQGLLRSGFISLLSGAPCRIGFAGAREGAILFYTKRIRVPAQHRHAVDRNIALVRSAFDTDLPAAFPSLRQKPEDSIQADRLLASPGLAGAAPLIAVAPAARWPSKIWPAASFAETIDRLCTRFPHAGVWLMGTEAERPITEAVASACIVKPPVDLAGRTDLGVLIEMLRASRVLLSNDSGPMHLAAALGTPVVAMFGPTDPTLTGPYGPGHVVFQAKCPRGPCFRVKCPRAGVCMESVAAEAVAAAAAELLERR